MLEEDKKAIVLRFNLAIVLILELVNVFNKFINICDIYNVKCKRYYIVTSPINFFLNN